MPTAEYEWRIINYMRHSSGPGGTVELNGMVANMNLQKKTTLLIWTSSSGLYCNKSYFQFGFGGFASLELCTYMYM